MSAPEINLFIVGTGVVGRALAELCKTRKDIVVRGIANTRGQVDSLEKFQQLLDLPSRPPPPLDIDDATLDAFAKFPNAVLVDATASDDIAPLYERAFQRDIAVVTANKKPLAGKLDRVPKSRTGKFRYSATVGAGLPVIDTIRTLKKECDEVTRIDCVLSGTLAFLASELADGASFSAALTAAKDRGYTEPDPRDDLSGKDVRNKLVILARELGANIETEDVALEPFVPAQTSLDAALDADFAARTDHARKRAQKLVYLARIEITPSCLRASCGPTLVDASHPAAKLHGAGALASFTTARHAETPLVISGSGAGGRVTAAALLADAARLFA